MSFERPRDPSTDPERRKAIMRSRERNLPIKWFPDKLYRVAVQVVGKQGRVHTVDVWHIWAGNSTEAALKAPIPDKYRLDGKFGIGVSEVQE